MAVLSSDGIIREPLRPAVEESHHDKRLLAEILDAHGGIKRWGKYPNVDAASLAAEASLD